MRLSLRSPVVVDARATSVATVAGLEQGYVVVPPEEKFRLLFTFLRRHR